MGTLFYNFKLVDDYKINILQNSQVYMPTVIRFRILVITKSCIYILLKENMVNFNARIITRTFSLFIDR